MGRIKYVIIFTVIILIALYFIPIPHRIQADMPAVMYNEEGQYTFSINARRHNYLLKQDYLIPEIKVYSKEDTLFSFDDIDYSMYKSSIPIEDTGDISHISFFYYIGNTNNLSHGFLDYSEKGNCYILKTEDFICIAPAENSADAHKVIQYFKDNNFDPDIK